jgi:hypothetical protein
LQPRPALAIHAWFQFIHTITGKGKPREKNPNKKKTDARTVLSLLMPRSAKVYGHGAAGSSSATKPAVIAAPRTKHSKYLTEFIASDPPDSLKLPKYQSTLLSGASVINL